MERNEHIVDLVAAVEARLTSLCPLLASVTRSQATSYKDIAELIPKLDVLPAAVVVLGPVDGEDDISTQASRYRIVNLGILIVGEYSAEGDEGAPEFWATIDQVHDAFIPTALRGESEGLPVAVCGDQQGANRGTLLIPGGYRSVAATKGRCAGVYNLLCLDTVAERIGLPADPADPAAPETGVAVLQDLDRFTLWQSTGWLRKFISWATIKTLLAELFAGITHASRHAAAGADPITPAAIGAVPVLRAYRQTAVDLVLSSIDELVQVTVAGRTATLPNPVGCAGKPYTIDNAASGDVYAATAAGTIEGEAVQAIPPDSSMSVYSDGTAWRFR